MKRWISIFLAITLLCGCTEQKNTEPPELPSEPVVEVESETPSIPEPPKEEQTKETPQEYDELWDAKLKWIDDDTLQIDKGDSLSSVNLVTENMTQVLLEEPNSKGNNLLYTTGDYIISRSEGGAYLTCQDGVWQMASLSIHDKDGKLLRNFEKLENPADEVMSLGVLAGVIEHMGDGIFAVPGHEAFFLYDINSDSLTMVHDYRDKVPDHKFKVYYGLRFGGKAGDRYIYLVTEVIDEEENSRNRLYSIDKNGNVQELYSEEEFVNIYAADNAVLAYTPDHEEKDAAWYYNIEGREGIFYEEYISNPVKFYETEYGWRIISDTREDINAFRVIDIAADGSIKTHVCGTELPSAWYSIKLCHVTGEIGDLKCYFINNEDKGIYCYEESKNTSTKIDTFPAELVLSIEKYFGNKAYAYIKDGNNVCARNYP